VKLTPFRLHRPETVEHATDLLDELGSAAALYAGGTELLLVAKFGLTEFTDLVDIKRIEELAGIDGDGTLRIGATTTHRELEHSPVVRDRWPSLAAMERHVGNIRVRNVGTLGGNLCFADPHSDPATYLIASGARLIARRGGAPPREIAVEEFTRGPYRNTLAAGELLVGVEVPPLPPGSVIVHRKMSFRERPAITVAANVTVRDGMVAEARLAVGSVGAAPARLPAAEDLLVGADASAPDDQQLLQFAQAAADEALPVADANGSVGYKRQLVRVLAGRCAREALSLAQQQPAA
jgi:carbon-monoxide dehydrogenase medium subunit